MLARAGMRLHAIGHGSPCVLRDGPVLLGASLRGHAPAKVELKHLLHAALRDGAAECPVTVSEIAAIVDKSAPCFKLRRCYTALSYTEFAGDPVPALPCMR